MFASSRTKSSGALGAVIDVTSLIDVMFVLVLFFLVTATFVKDTGIVVRRPAAVTNDGAATESLRISVASSGAVYVDGKPMELGELGQRVRQHTIERPAAGVIVVADEALGSGRLVAVIDAARLAGAKDVALATRPAK
jgi:biopolymer transport protein ExbD